MYFSVLPFQPPSVIILDVNKFYKITETKEVRESLNSRSWITTSQVSCRFSKAVLDDMIMNEIPGTLLPRTARGRVNKTWLHDATVFQKSQRLAVWNEFCRHARHVEKLLAAILTDCPAAIIVEFMKKERLESLPIYFPHIPSQAGYGSGYIAQTPYYPARCYKLLPRLVDLPPTPGGVYFEETRGTQTEPQPDFDFSQDADEESCYSATTELDDATAATIGPTCGCCFICRKCRQIFPKFQHYRLYCAICCGT